MALFKYVGSLVKDNGKVDIKVGNYNFINITPNVFEIEVDTDSIEQNYLENSVDPFEDIYMYIKQ